MYAILHIPTGTYLLRTVSPFETYKEEDRDAVLSIFNYYCTNGRVDSALTRYIPYNDKEYEPDISEFEIVEVD